MTDTEFAQLLARYEQGLCSPAEQQRLEQWLDTIKEGPAPFRSAAEKEPVRAALLAAIREKTGRPAGEMERQETAVRPMMVAHAGQGRRPLNPWHRVLAVAASVLLVLAVGAYLFVRNGHLGQPTLTQAQIDLPPGHDQATLTLADGSSIRLTDAQPGDLARQGGAAVRKTQAGEIVYRVGAVLGTAPAGVAFNTLAVPRGGQYRMVLADGTKVWLNAASALRYPATFTGHARTVELTGEAYFEVAPDKQKPFHVKTATQEVTVLGTHFNVNAYANELAVRTTLLEGAVVVTQPGATQPLRPGQQATTAAGNPEISVRAVDPEEAVAWKNGLFRFKQADLKTVMRQLERWYDVDVAYEGPVSAKAFTGEIYRNVNAGQVLEMLRYSNVHFRLEAAPNGSSPRKRIIVMP